jgi:cytochrome b561
MIWLHWLMAGALVVMVLLGLIMAGLPRGDETKQWMLNIHLGLGVTVLLAAIWRLRLRRIRSLPPLPESYRGWERGLVRVVHGGFYVLMLAMPLAGLTVWLLDPFLDGPGLAGQSLAMTEWAARVYTVHYLGAWLLIALVIVHLAGALRGQFGKNVERRVLQRMLP